MTIQDLFLGVILRTNNPMTPIYIQNLSSNINLLAPIIAGISSQDEADRLAMALCDGADMGNGEISISPEFIMALMGLLDIALQTFVRQSKHGEGPVQ